MKNNSLVIVKNNREGRRLIALLRKHLRDTPKKVVVYGRGPRPAYPRYQNNLPLGMSKKLAVYLYDKPKFRMVRRIRVTPPVYEWVKVPTKWADKTETPPTNPAPAFGHPDL